ncbi:hypothetical protein ABW19_dt0204731 [Dactylella cylindrospora]|nr:hypothetical protein ABW19_dt0204731 [Dactylella cylindrospora]
MPCKQTPWHPSLKHRISLALSSLHRPATPTSRPNHRAYLALRLYGGWQDFRIPVSPGETLHKSDLVTADGDIVFASMFVVWKDDVMGYRLEGVVWPQGCLEDGDGEVTGGCLKVPEGGAW